MTKATVLMDHKLELSERYRAEIKVFEVEPSQKYPNGIKVRFVLIDMIEMTPKLLIDNHEPFGFHVHEELPKDKNSRRLLKISTHLEALDEFLRLAWEIIHGKN